MFTAELGPIIRNSDIIYTFATAVGANTVITLNRVAGFKIPSLVQLQYSYSGIPTGGRLTIDAENGGYLDLDILETGHKSLYGLIGIGFGFLAFIPGSVGKVTITLYSGGAGITGKLNCQSVLIG